MEAPETVLIKKARDGNQLAAERLFRKYQDRVFSYLFRLIGNRELAEEAAQETFMKGFRSLKRYREKGMFKSWLFKIAHREGLRVLKKERQHRILRNSPNGPEKDETELIDPAPLPAERLMEQEQARRVEHALDALTEAEKQVVLLRLYEGLPFKEIADIMACPLNTALGRMHNAVKKLRQELEEEQRS